MNLSATIIPKSTQLNADDLIGGPRTIEITSVDSGSAEQPVAIHYKNDSGRPYFPSKSMRRVLIVIWGAEGSAYIGRKLTLFRNPLVKWAGEPVGGIQISHASDIDAPVQIALTETRGKRKPFTVEPLKNESPKLANLPAEWAEWTIEQRAENRASLGVQTLQEWWGTLTADERKTYKAKLDTDWKPAAQKAGTP